MKQPSFPGKDLRERREELGMTLADVYAEIHVPIEHLRALEEGRLRELPGPTFALGFLNSYCALLDVNAERYIHAFRDAAGVRPAAPVYRAAPKPPAEGRPRWMAEAIAWGAVCAVLLLGWLTFSALTTPLREDAGTRVDAGTLEYGEPGSAATGR